MAFDALFNLDIIEVMVNYLEKVRPPIKFRNEVDIDYRLENQSVILFERRHYLSQPDKTFENDYAKATYIKRSSCWKIYWRRGNLEWENYRIKPEVKSLKKFLEIVDKDEYGCFSG